MITSFSIIARATSWGWATSFGPCVKNILFFFRFDAGKPANSQGGSQAWQSCAISCILELSPWSQTEPGERKLFLLYFENSSWELSAAKQADNEDDNYLSPWSSWRRVNSSSPWDFTKEKRSKRSNVCLIQWYNDTKKGGSSDVKTAVESEFACLASPSPHPKTWEGWTLSIIFCNTTDGQNMFPQFQQIKYQANQNR